MSGPLPLPPSGPGYAAELNQRILSTLKKSAAAPLMSRAENYRLRHAVHHLMHIGSGAGAGASRRGQALEFDPEMTCAFKGGGSQRRRTCDWGV